MPLNKQLTASFLVLLSQSSAFRPASPISSNAKSTRENTLQPPSAVEIASPSDILSSIPLEHHLPQETDFPSLLLLPEEDISSIPLEQYQPQPVLEETKPKKTEKSAFDKLKQRFTMRLNTHEDSSGLHKYSAAGWFLTLIAIIVTGAFHNFQEVPNWLEIPTWALTGLTITQAVNGADMAIKYRKGDPLTQRGMINMSGQMLNTIFAQVFLSPYAPEALNNFWVGNGIMILSLLPGLIMTTDDIVNLPAKIQARCLRKREKEHMDFGVSGDAAFGTFMCVVPFILVVWNMIYACDPSHDRSWVLGSLYHSSPTLLAESWYSFAFFNLAIGAGAFAITLRDKSLISKWAEQALCIGPILPAVALFLSAHEMMPHF